MSSTQAFSLTGHIKASGLKGVYPEGCSPSEVAAFLPAGSQRALLHQKGHHPLCSPHSAPVSEDSFGEGVGRQAGLYGGHPLGWGSTGRAQSSLSDRVSYCSDSRGSRSHTRCGATGAPPGGCCWACMEGEAMEVGGVPLNMRMVRGL